MVFLRSKILKNYLNVTDTGMMFFMCVLYDATYAVQCTECQISCHPFYIVSYYIKWATTSWTYRTMYIPFLKCTYISLKIMFRVQRRFFFRSKNKKRFDYICKTRRKDIPSMHLTSPGITYQRETPFREIISLLIFPRFS